MRTPLIALEVVLGFVVPVGWGLWELLALRRERRKDAAAKAPEPVDHEAPSTVVSRADRQPP